MSSGLRPFSALALTCAATIAAIGCAAGLCAIKPRASAARPWISGSASVSAAVSAGAAAASPIRPMANAAIWRTSASGIGLHQRRQRGNRLGQFDAADRERRAPANARFGVAEQRDQIAAAASQHALILELQDPPHLLFEHRHRRRRRDLRLGRRSCRTATAQAQKRIKQAKRSTRRSGHRLRCRNVACVDPFTHDIDTDARVPAARRSSRRPRYQSPAR